VVPDVLGRQRVAVAACAAAALLVTAAVAWKEPNDGAAAVVVALVLAPLAVAATAALGARVAGDRFAIGAAAAYVVLPLIANRFMLSTYRTTFDTHALPALVGTQHTVLFAGGIAVAIATALGPKVVAAAGGVVAFVLAASVWQLAGVGRLAPGFHETVWSVSLLEWLLVAGILGILLRAPLLGLAVGGWLVAAVLYGAHRGYDDGAFWRSLAVAAPAVAIAFSSPASGSTPDNGSERALSSSSSNATRWARITFWSASFEMTVE
jgi:hypothetical protein